MPQSITIKVTADTKEAEAGARRIETAYKSALDSTAGSVNLLRGAFGALAAVGVVSLFKQIADAALESAINLDKMRQTTAALTGSLDTANKKIAELRALAQKSPGVTTSFAVDLFNQFKAIGTIAEPTINKLITSLGKLNAIF